MEWFISLWTLGIISFYTGEATQEKIFLLSFQIFHLLKHPPHNKSLYTSPFCPPCRCLEDRVTIDCSNSSLTSIPNYPAQSSDDDYEDEGGGSLIESLILPSNKITHVDLEFLRHYPKLTSLILRSNAIRSLSKSSTDYQPFFGLIHVDLSNNHLHVLHSYVFSGFPSLKTLNLSSNVIHTDHFFDSSPNLSEIDLSKNKLSRLNDGTFGLLRHLSLLDLSHNSLMKIEDNVLVGMNITHLDLGHNSLRKVPTLALRKLTSIKTLLLDGNLFSVLESGSISNVRAEFLSLSHNPHLIRLDNSAIDNCHTLETLTVNNNPNLIYVHPRVVKRAPVLAAMDLSFNGLYSLESQIIKEIPSLKALSLAGNNFKCHCSLKWIGKLTQSSSTSNLRLLTPNSVVCKMDDHSSPLPLNVDSTGMNEECQPYILPLFLDNSTELMGKNASWMCKALGSSKMDLTWKLPSLHKERRVVGNGECLERVCVENNVLKIAYLHIKDAGRYTCVARNKYGQDQRGVQLNVRSENIQIFPVTVASRFVTLSWNTSTHLSTGRGYILQVKREEHADSNKDSRFPRNSPIVKQYEDIDVGLKMNSYTVNGLDPGQTYRFLLCLRKGEYVLTISSAVLKTKNPGYEVELGIETDYVSLLSVCIALSGLVASCISMILFRWVRYHRGHKDLDTISTREMITSPSDHSSITGIHYTLGDESRLMDNEVTSPVEDMRETRT
ncbi:unnamed protein product [Lepeophtheirus salmonis]|uniref:(salmon louse) hypothetical protein n=1 Tax=Lepeophtheirus salmonis TaxID=72036 RepID=A0A7R8H2X0_LEPSM|nr:unnamed protein product [Lepeophtheirus salmonis]CAF2836706.1 unnamed protein product [Lepeophtheirus salmonis]